MRTPLPTPIPIQTPDLTPQGRTRLTSTEKQTILSLRLERFSIKQISNLTGRSTTTIKRVIYPKNNG